MYKKTGAVFLHIYMEGKKIYFRSSVTDKANPCDHGNAHQHVHVRKKSNSILLIQMRLCVHAD